MELGHWSSVAKIYNPILAGSIDATDSVPHDRGIVRAVNSVYKPNKSVDGDPEKTVFVGRLNHTTVEDQLQNMFSRYGQIKKCRLVRDFITGFSKGYGFVEFVDKSDAKYAISKLNHTVIDDRIIIVMFECERNLKGWIPRRFGGGYGGKKESGQLRFGCTERPFRKPISSSSRNKSDQGKTNDTFCGEIGKSSHKLCTEKDRSSKELNDNANSTLNEQDDNKYSRNRNLNSHGINAKNRCEPATGDKKYERDRKRNRRSRSRSRDYHNRRRSRSRSRKSNSVSYEESLQKSHSKSDKHKLDRNKESREKRWHKEVKSENVSRKYVRSQLSLTPE